MGVTKSEKIWHNGRMVDWDAAQIHVLSHVVSYGSALFEGMRCYATPQGPALFRLGDHLRRLLHSSKIYRMDPPFGQAELERATLELIRVNRLPQAYVRPIVLRGPGAMGVGARNEENPIEVFIAAWNWGEYLGGKAHSEGVDVRVASWRRMTPDTLPAMAKAAANYMNSQLIKQEAWADGYAEGIALDANGNLSEGSGENVFLVRQGTLYTPPLSSSVLPGITRDCVIRIAAEMGLAVREETLPREALYIADEVFFCGTAVEITPVRSVDRIAVADGRPGEATRAVQKRFFALAKGEAEDLYGWRTPVAVEAPVGA